MLEKYDSRLGHDHLTSYSESSVVNNYTQLALN